MAELATKSDLQALSTHFDDKLENLETKLSLRLTLRLGVMIAAGIAVLAAIIKLA